MNSPSPPCFYLLVLNKAVGQQTRDSGVCFNTEDSRFGFQFSCRLWGRAPLSVVPGCSCTLGRRRGKRSICPQLCLLGAPTGSCQQPWQFLLQNGSASPSSPLPSLLSLLPSAFSTPLPGMPKEPKRSFFYEAHMHRTSAVCLSPPPPSSAMRLHQEGSYSRGKRQTGNKVMYHPDWSGQGACLGEQSTRMRR